MTIIKVTFHDWNGCDRSIEVTSNMCASLNLCHTEEDMFLVAIRYIKRRYIECMGILAVEIIAD